MLALSSQTLCVQGCWRFAGWAHDGRPIMLIRADLWKPSEYSVEEYNKYVVRPREVKPPSHCEPTFETLHGNLNSRFEAGFHDG